MTADVIVVGAGIVGAACAAELAARGASVDVIEARGVGGGATAAGMGHIVVMNDSPAEFALSHFSRELWLALAPHLRKRDAFSRCGTLWVAEDEEELAAARAMQCAFASSGVRADVLDAAALREVEPALSHAMVGGLRIADDAIVYAPAAAQFLLTCSRGAARIRVSTDCAVAAVEAGRSQASVTLANGERRAAGHVVVANGLAASGLIDDIPLEPKKGHLVITDRYPGTIRHQVLELGYIKSAHHARGTSVAFNAQPRPTGQILIGSSRQFGTVNPAVDMSVLGAMLRRASRFLPGIGGLNAIRAWTGFRAATPDGLPIIGPARHFGDRLWVATGHEGLGVTTSLGTAKLLVAQMFGDPAHAGFPDAAAFSPRRFAKAHADG
ncbi:FAD-binding oxidoreductase [Caballeronia sp. LZ062]|uniref:NAD(P)/FAD-dependent oxidoreductase n=1 Tax=unclassified Caballeronia TaxID=2646786 RepID=UPI002860C98F|nr:MULTISPECIES: FAD-binding oxidoreductase [unclassified Caballeronia]MDR5857262.1 FAD-binding oxidoreductase [Caballeronia sp. LZ050]MDR5868813.1 FAD-binding oxidoreductase [Caballeronia sp. LZ062]